MATYVTKSHLENFTEKLLVNDKKIRDELKEEISKLPQGGTDVDVATTDTAGIVKPDGTSITVDSDGTIHATTDTNQIKQDIEDYMTEHPVSADVGDKTVTEEKLSDDVLAVIKSKKILFADTVADINNLALSETENQIVRTLGFYNKLDGGGALYNVYKSSGSKNLLFVRPYENQSNGASIQITSDGCVVLNGDFSNKPVFEFSPFTIKPLLKANTSYILSYEYVSGSFIGTSAILHFDLYTSSPDRKNFYIKNLSSNYTTKKTATILSTGECQFKTMKFSVGGSNIIFDNFIIRLQIEEGTEATEWKPGEYGVDEHSCIELDNNFHAELIVLNNKINMKQLGYFPNKPEVDCHDSISNYINLCERDAEKYELYFPAGKWYFSETNIQNGRKGVILTGVSSQVATDDRTGETSIAPFNDNQEYIWNLGISTTSKTIVGGNELRNFTFSTEEKTFCKIGLLLTYCCYSSFDGLYFHRFNGTGLRLNVGWENEWGFLNFRGVGYIDKDKTYNAMEFANFAGVSSAISANVFDYINFEGISGSCILAEQGSNFTHSEIRNIQIEWTHCETKADGITVQYNVDQKEWDDKSPDIEHVYLVKGNCGIGNAPIVIETITMSSTGKNCYTISWTDDEGVEHKRYKVRSAVFGENEGYDSSNTHGIGVVVGKLAIAGSLPIYHSAYNVKTGTYITVMNGDLGVTAPQVAEYYPKNIQICNRNNEFKFTEDGYNVMFPSDAVVDKDAGLYVGYIKGSKSNLSSSHRHGIMYANLDGSKKIKVRMYINKESAEQVDNNLIPVTYVTGSDGVKRQLRLIELHKWDFTNGTYPIKEWFDYEVPASFLPFGSIAIQVQLHRSNGLYIDYIGISNENKIIDGQSLINNNTGIKYSPIGSMIWCHDRRETEDSSNGVMCVYNGDSWKSLSGKAVSDLLLAKYTITSNLTNCTGTNSNTSALLNTSYTTTISATSGYSLTDADITCTMGGNPVTVTNRKINISKVTGDIIITATAKTNL